MKGLFKQYNYSYSHDEYQKIWGTALFIFDTNTLLNLYRYQSKTKDEFLQVLEKISDRIWIPHHVALEFQRNRVRVICEQKELFSKTKKAIESVQTKLNSEIEQLKLRKRHSLINSDDFVKDFSSLTEGFLNDLDKLKSTQQHLSKEDQLKEKLENLFENKVGDPPKDQKELDELYREAEFRYKNKIAPGYLDKDKEDVCIDSSLVYRKKYGDFLVWKQLLNYAKLKNYKQVIFITNDAKDDWWLHFNASGEKFSQPRPELIDEALHQAGIEDFVMYDSENLLQYSSEYLNVDVSESSIKEVGDTNKIYNNEIIKSSFHEIRESRSIRLDKLKKAIALEKVKEFQNKLKYDLYRNKGILEYPVNVLECPECGIEAMIYNELSSTGYQCTFCENENSDEIEIECSICGSMWPNSEIAHIEWTDEGDIERVCPYCRRDPDYVSDDD